ncbi:MAG: hypothetical protein HPY71_01640 [Firmicutes bacterium]|nr:hypothetical protein [Bacillota bacterium]
MGKRFEIGKAVSNAAWGDVDKSRIWRLLKQGLEEGATGVAEAIREVYAVVKAEVNKDLTEADCWGPHHEVRDDGTVVLNRAGLVAAVGALAGARSNPDLTAEQRREAVQHLTGHYRELDMPLPAVLGGTGEMASLMATVTGEMRVEDIPLAPWADIAALKVGDTDPLEVVVKVPAGKSRRGWDYRPEALQRIVGEVMTQGLPGFLGHQKPEDVDHEFPTPVTHWVGALWKDGAAYFRGVVDKAAADLKRWIKAKAVRTVSIFGIPKLDQAGGETRVVDYQPLSIDWTPLGRAGMPTEIVAIGEMDEIIGGEQKKMTWKELVAQLKTMLATGEVTRAQVVGEMGWKGREIIGEIDADLLKEVSGTKDTLGKVKEALKVSGEMDVVKAAGEAVKDAETLKKVREALGVSGEMDVVKVAEEAAKAVAEGRKAKHEALVNEVLKEKVSGEMAQGLVKKLLQVPEGATKEQIAGEIDKLLADEVVKAAISKSYVDKPPAVGGNNNNQSSSLRVKRQAF